MPPSGCHRGAGAGAKGSGLIVAQLRGQRSQGGGPWMKPYSTLGHIGVLLCFQDDANMDFSIGLLNSLLKNKQPSRISTRNRDLLSRSTSRVAATLAPSCSLGSCAPPPACGHLGSGRSQHCCPGSTQWALLRLLQVAKWELSRRCSPMVL